MNLKEITMTDSSSNSGEPGSMQEITNKEQYVSFMLGGQEYAVEIRRVQEIKGWDTVTRMPFAPSYMLGVLNLRGAIVPVIDLRLRLGLTPAPRAATTVIIVVSVPGKRASKTIGMVVDAVADVHDVVTQDVQPPPAIVGGTDVAFVKGLANHDGRLLILIDIDHLLRQSILEETRSVA